MRPPPPKKRRGQATGRRIFDGVLLDVKATAELLGTSEGQVRSQVYRRLLPYRKLGGRIVFVREELLAFINCLPGVTPEEALANHVQRSLL